MSEEDVIILMFAIVIATPFFITLLAFLDFLNVHKRRVTTAHQEAQSFDD